MPKIQHQSPCHFRKVQIGLITSIDRATKALFGIIKTPVLVVLHEVIVADSLAITLGMGGEVKILKNLDRSPPVVHRSQRARRFIGEENCLAKMIVPTTIAATYQPNRIKDLDVRIDSIDTDVKAPITVDALIKQTELPFVERVMRVRVSFRFKLSLQLGIYEGKTDPMDHLDSFKNFMLLQGASNKVMCKAFSAALRGPVRP